jgi:hypothetical protein
VTVALYGMLFIDRIPSKHSSTMAMVFPINAFIQNSYAVSEPQWFHCMDCFVSGSQWWIEGSSFLIFLELHHKFKIPLKKLTSALLWSELAVPEPSAKWSSVCQSD